MFKTKNAQSVQKSKGITASTQSHLKIAEIKENQEFEKFLAKNPEAAVRSAAIKALAYTPTFIRSSYDEIWKQAFGGNTSPRTPETAARKVVGRRILGGMKPRGKGGAEPGGGGEHIYSRDEIQGMDMETYTKNENKIKKQMREGLIT